MYTALVEKHSFEIAVTDEGFMVDGRVVSCDLSRIADGYFHIILENQSYRAEIVETDPSGKRFTFKINGRHYPVQLKDKFDLLLEKMGMNSMPAQK
jgi:hypothetical protein